MFKFLFILVVAAFTCGAHALPMSYSYTSGTLSPSGTSGIPAVTNLSVNFTADLGAGLDNVDARIDVSVWNITDGITTADETSAGYFLETFWVTTDANAVITSLLLEVESTKGYEQLRYGEHWRFELLVNAGSSGQTFAGTSYCSRTEPVGDRDCDDHARASSAEVSGGPTTVPSPATIALFGLGLAGLGISRRKRTTQR